jgi:hypothetical protein
MEYSLRWMRIDFVTLSMVDIDSMGIYIIGNPWLLQTLVVMNIHESF